MSHLLRTTCHLLDEAAGTPQYAGVLDYVRSIFVVPYDALLLFITLNE